MATYLIGYDLHPTKDEKYENLTDAIKNVGSRWWHHLDSTWIVVSDKSEIEIRDILWAHMYKDDQLLVVKSSGIGAWQGFSESGNKWLKDYL
jgi:hypothetical protein